MNKEELKNWIELSQDGGRWKWAENLNASPFNKDPFIQIHPDGQFL